MRPAEAASELVDALVGCLDEGPLAAKPVERLATAVLRIPVRMLPVVEQVLRSGSLFVRGWDYLSISDVARFGGEGPKRTVAVPHCWAFHAVASCHANGFVRQRALRALGDLGDEGGLPFAILRLNDWVKEVCETALDVLQQYLKPEHAPSLVAALPLVLGLERRHRRDHAEVVARTLGLLRTEGCREALEAGRRLQDRELRRLCFRLASESQGTDAASLLGEALSDPEPGLRLWAVQQSRSHVEQQWARALVHQRLADRIPQVRRAAFEVLAGALPAEEAISLAEQGLLDENTGARWMARLIRLHRGGPIDLAGFYRYALREDPTPSRIRAALLGLGESGDASDNLVVRPFLTDERASVRRAAIRALARLEPPGSVQPFLDALVDRAPGVSKEGRRALEPRRSSFGPTRLAPLIDDVDAPVHVRRNALMLAASLSKWDSLPLLLAGCGAGEPVVVERARGLLHAWRNRYNRSYQWPSQEQLDRIEEALRRVSAKLARAERADLTDIVRYMRSAG